jgi:hypothetical protein
VSCCSGKAIPIRLKPKGSIELANEIARKQGAKSLELRAITSLAWLLVLQGKRDAAQTMLAEIYGWSLRASTPPT